MPSKQLLVAVVLAAGCEKGASPKKVVANKPAVAAPKKALPSRPPALFRWPVQPFTMDLRSEVEHCDIKKLVKQHDAKLAVDDDPPAFATTTGCDLAVLAQACADHFDNKDPPPACIDAYREAVKANPLFAFDGGLVDSYFGKVALVDPPPFARSKVTRLVLSYKWTGEGEPVQWRLAVGDAPSVNITGAPAKATANVSAQLAAFGQSLGSFMPIAHPVEAVNCFDNYPEWEATIDFDDHTTLRLSTHRSNLLGLGGPWQMTLDGVTYMQLDSELTHAVADMVKALELPLGEPAAMTCHGFDLQAAVVK